jgi:alanyl-tRNA synthetase
MATLKLYWRDDFFGLTSFEAGSVHLAAWPAGPNGKGTRPSLVLDQTLFYPEAGGQLADHGTLSAFGRTLTVDDVQIDDDGVIHHLGPEIDSLGEIQNDPGRAGTAVRGEIALDRRRDFTAQHTAQHALSRALLDAAGAATVSSRLGATSCTIDVDRAEIHERDVARAEDLVNAIVLADVPCAPFSRLTASSRRWTFGARRR